MKNTAASMILVISFLAVAGCRSIPKPPPAGEGSPTGSARLGRAAPVATGLDGDHCAQILQGGVFNQLSINSRREFSQLLAERLKWSRQQLEQEKSEGGGGASVSIAILEVGAEGSGKTEHLESLREKFEGDSSYELSDSEFLQLSSATASVDILDAWKDCIARAADSTGGRPISLSYQPGLSANNVVLLARVVDGGDFRVRDVFVQGGTLQTGQLRIGESYPPDTALVITRDIHQDLIVLLSTDRGTAKFIRRGEPKVKPAPVPPAKAWHREDALGRPYVKTFSHTSENMHNKKGGKLASGTYELGVPEGRIYEIKLKQEGEGWPWNYHTTNGHGHEYEPDVTISADGGSFIWRRKWVGKPTTEYYTAYYEVYR